MTEKRYYARDFEELYYIIDSEVISEAEFDEKYLYRGYSAFEDSLTGEEIVKLLNENEQLKCEISSLKFRLGICENHKLFSRRQLEKENKQLKQQEKKLYNYFKNCFVYISEESFKESWELIKDKGNVE